MCDGSLRVSHMFYVAWIRLGIFLELVLAAWLHPKVHSLLPVARMGISATWSAEALIAHQEIDDIVHEFETSRVNAVGEADARMKANTCWHYKVFDCRGPRCLYDCYNRYLDDPDTYMIVIIYICTFMFILFQVMGGCLFNSIFLLVKPL